jgi:hypothetical protein
VHWYSVICVELEAVHSLVIMVADTDDDDVFTLINLPNDYDMVVRFSDDHDAGAFIRECEHIMRVRLTPARYVAVRHTNLDQLLATAETRQGRQHKLEQFFREAYAKAFKEPALMAPTADAGGLVTPIERAAMSDVTETNMVDVSEG